MLQTLPEAHSGLAQINWRLFWSPQQRLLFLYMRPSGPGVQTRNWTLGTLAFSFSHPPPPPFPIQMLPLLASITSQSVFCLALHSTVLSPFLYILYINPKQLKIYSCKIHCSFSTLLLSCMSRFRSLSQLSRFISHFPHFFHFALWSHFLPLSNLWHHFPFTFNFVPINLTFFGFIL